jgi:hypothetical protein
MAALGAGETLTKQSEQAVTFLCSMPDVLSQLKIGRDGMRIQLDVPESELANALPLVKWRDRVLRVTVEPSD